MLLVNTDPTERYTVHRGDRIAQLVIQRVDDVELASRSTTLDTTSRDTYGFGSTGR